MACHDHDDENLKKLFTFNTIYEKIESKSCEKVKWEKTTATRFISEFLPFIKRIAERSQELHWIFEFLRQRQSTAILFEKTDYCSKTEDRIRNRVRDILQDNGIISSIVGTAADFAASVGQFLRNKNWNPKDMSDSNLQHALVRGGLMRNTALNVCYKIIAEQRKECLDPTLLANPLAYRAGQLNELHSETISNLMQTGVAVQKMYLGEKARCQAFKDIEFRDFDGQLSKLPQSGMRQIRSDRIMFISGSSISQAAENGLHHLIDKMRLIPFELNLKADLKLNFSDTFQLGCLDGDGSFITPHVDGGFGEEDVGRKLTAFYLLHHPNGSESDGGTMYIYPSKMPTPTSSSNPIDPRITEINSGSDLLVLFWSRNMAWCQTECHRKSFAVRCWMNGPPDYDLEASKNETV